MSTTNTPWINKTGIDYEDEETFESLLGFIYRIKGEKPDGTGWFYIGRKQFWNKRGRYWTESDWRTYRGSSKTVPHLISESVEGSVHFEILAVFTSKSGIRFAEAAAIICSGAYWPNDGGSNWSFEGCKGILALTEQDEQQMENLLKQVRR